MVACRGGCDVRSPGRSDDVRSHRHRRGSRWLVGGAPTVLLPAGPVAMALRRPTEGCPGSSTGAATVITVAVASADQASIQHLAQRWTAGGPSAAGQCVAVTVVTREPAQVV